MELLWIGLAFASGLAVRQLGLPPLVGYLAAGFLLNALGVDDDHGEVLQHVAHAGVLLLLMTVGLKIRLRNVIRPEVWAAALVHLSISTLLIGTVLHLAAGLSWQVAILIGITLGFSSTVVAAKVLEEKRELQAFHGRIAIGILIIQDLVAVALLSFSTGEAPSPWALSVLALPLLRPLVRWMLDWVGHDELLVLYGLLLALVVGGGAFAAVGLSAELGALLLGVLLAGHGKATELSNVLWGIKEIFLVGFFLQIGLAGLPTMELFGYALLLALLLPIKALMFFGVLVLFRLRARTAFLTGISLATYSEFALIVMQMNVERWGLGNDWLVLLALTVALSFLLAAPVNRMAHVLFERFESRLVMFELHQRHPDEQPITLGAAEILIVGLNRAGVAAYQHLKQHGERVVAMDADTAKLERHVRSGLRVVYGDADDPGLWQHLNLDHIRVIILTMPAIESKLLASTLARRAGYQGIICTATYRPDEEAKILDHGCNLVFNFADEAGVGLAEHVLKLRQVETAESSPAPATIDRKDSDSS